MPRERDLRPRKFRSWGSIALLLFLIAGSRELSAKDRERLEATRETFVADFSLLPSRELYLYARHLKPGCPTEHLARSLFEAFWMDSSSLPRRESQFSYLNLQSGDGRFCYQPFWDPAQQRVQVSDQEHY